VSPTLNLNPNLKLLHSSGLYIVTEQGGAADWELDLGRTWWHGRPTLSEPLALGSIMAQTGGDGEPWRELPIADAPPALRALIESGQP
jgi:hypothetical protein